MRLYRTPSGSWAGTQADARALAKSEGSSWMEVIVPDDKPGLLAFLNDNRVGACREPVERTERLEAPPIAQAPQATPTPPPRPDMSASATLSRMDNPGRDIDGAVEMIATSRGHALKRFAGAVALAYQRLAA